MNIFKKATALCLIFSVLTMTACSSGGTSSSSGTSAPSEMSAAGENSASDGVSESTEVSASQASEQDSISSDISESSEESTADSAESKYFTVFVDGKTSADCFSFEGDKGVWAHLVNPYNELSLFNPLSAKDFPDDTKSIAICFNANGVTSEISAFCGLCAYGSGDEDEELQVWDKDTYKALSGENFEFVIDKDGYYELTVPIDKLGAGLDFWEGLNYAYIIEIAFYGAQKTDSDGEYLEEFTEGLSFEFLGIKAD